MPLSALSPTDCAQQIDRAVTGDWRSAVQVSWVGSSVVRWMDLPLW